MLVLNAKKVASRVTASAAQDATETKRVAAGAGVDADGESHREEVEVEDMDTLAADALRVLLTAQSVVGARLRALVSLSTHDLYIAVSSKPGGGRGLFVGRAFDKDEDICFYGGIVTWEATVRQRAPDHQRHARRTGTGHVLDGFPLAELFPVLTAEEEAIERAAPAQARRRLLPRGDAGALRIFSDFHHHPHPPVALCAGSLMNRELCGTWLKIRY